MPNVTLIDPHDREIGAIEKMLAHRYGMLHRAFSIFIFRERNKSIELLLQKRNNNKYHSGGLWTNTCCGHPQLHESTLDAATQRLKEEMGIHAQLKEVGSFHYIASFPNGLTENEIDHVLVGFYDEPFQANYDEISEYAWVTLASLQKDLQAMPEKYTAWFAQTLALVLQQQDQALNIKWNL